MKRSNKLFLGLVATGLLFNSCDIEQVEPMQENAYYDAYYPELDLEESIDIPVVGDQANMRLQFDQEFSIGRADCPESKDAYSGYGTGDSNFRTDCIGPVTLTGSGSGFNEAMAGYSATTYLSINPLDNSGEGTIVIEFDAHHAHMKFEAEGPLQTVKDFLGREQASLSVKLTESTHPLYEGYFKGRVLIDNLSLILADNNRLASANLSIIGVFQKTETK